MSLCTWYSASRFFVIKEASVINSGTFIFSCIALSFVDDRDVDEELDFKLAFLIDFELPRNDRSDLLFFNLSFIQLQALYLKEDILWSISSSQSLSV